jgi:dihydrofolate reductase
VDEALAIAAGDSEPFVIGGAEIYRLFLPLAQRLYLTRVVAAVDGDTRFELPPLDNWRLVSHTEFSADANNELPHRDEVWERYDLPELPNQAKQQGIPEPVTAGDLTQRDPGAR